MEETNLIYILLIIVVVVAIIFRKKIIEFFKPQNKKENSFSLGKIIVPICILISVLVYIMGFMMYNNAYIIPIFEKYSELDEVTRAKYIGKLLFQLSGLFLTAYILKYLLGMRHFKEAIKNIFVEIFREHEFLKGLDKVSLLNIAKNVSTANRDIVFNDKTKDNESVIKLKNYFENHKDKNKDKNYLVMSSEYKTTLLSNGIEIMHRKITCKVLQGGRFLYKFKFTAPDKNENLNHKDYEEARRKNRFQNISYDSLLRSSCPNDGFHIKETFSLEKNVFTNYKKEKENGVQIKFEKLHTVKDEIITLELSISHPFKLTNHEEIEDYYNSSYSYPHAIRFITFQQERYSCEENCSIPIITPILYSAKEKIIEGSFSESIYYKTYKWDIFYSQEDSERVSLKVE